MHILGLNAVPDSEAHSQLGVCEKTLHTAAEMMSTFNNSCWRLHYRITSEDKDSLIRRVGSFELLTLHEGCDVISIGVLQRFHISSFEIGGCWAKFSSVVPDVSWVSAFPWGRAVCSCMRKLNPAWSSRSNTIIPIPWVWVAANLSWLGTGLSN